MTRYHQTVCACQVETGPNAPEGDRWVQIERQDRSLNWWILPCELHIEYGREMEAKGFDDGICK